MYQSSCILIVRLTRTHCVRIITVYRSNIFSYLFTRFSLFTISRGPFVSVEYVRGWGRDADKNVESSSHRSVMIAPKPLRGCV